MELITPYYKKHIFVCINEKENKESCAPKGAIEIHKALKSYVKEHGLREKIRVSKTYCQDLCAHGPVVTIQPDNIVYKQVSMDDVQEIIEKHIINT